MWIESKSSSDSITYDDVDYYKVQVFDLREALVAEYRAESAPWVYQGVWCVQVKPNPAQSIQYYPVEHFSLQVTKYMLPEQEVENIRKRDHLKRKLSRRRYEVSRAREMRDKDYLRYLWKVYTRQWEWCRG